jgi:hypothetical protein
MLILVMSFADFLTTAPYPVESATAEYHEQSKYHKHEFHNYTPFQLNRSTYKKGIICARYCFENIGHLRHWNHADFSESCNIGMIPGKTKYSDISGDSRNIRIFSDCLVRDESLKRI